MLNSIKKEPPRNLFYLEFAQLTVIAFTFENYVMQDKNISDDVSVGRKNRC